jgi:hypothetical protein
MTTKDAIIHAVEELPSEYLDELAAYLQKMKLRAAHQKVPTALERKRARFRLAPPRGG